MINWCRVKDLLRIYPLRLRLTGAYNVGKSSKPEQKIGENQGEKLDMGVKKVKALNQKHPQRIEQELSSNLWTLNIKRTYTQ